MPPYAHTSPLQEPCNKQPHGDFQMYNYSTELSMALLIETCHFGPKTATPGNQQQNLDAQHAFESVAAQVDLVALRLLPHVTAPCGRNMYGAWR